MGNSEHYREELSVNLNDEVSFESLEKLADSDTGKEFGIYRVNSNHISLGKGLSSAEFEGEGLPHIEKENNYHNVEFQINFDIRLLHDGNGNLELTLAEKGKKTFFRLPVFKGLNSIQAESASREFMRKKRYIIPKYLYMFLWACYRKQDQNYIKRKESYKNIISSFETEFKEMLIWKDFKEESERIENGYKIKKYVRVKSGRNKGTRKPRKLSTKEILNQENREDKIKDAIKKAKNPENKTELANIIGIARITLRDWLKEIGIQTKSEFYNFIRFAESGK